MSCVFDFGDYIRGGLRILGLIGIGWSSPGVASAAKLNWQPVAPEELQQTASALEPAAPAEILSLLVEIDDRNYPRERKLNTYVRLKIFDPGKTENLTRLNALNYSGRDDVLELNARLTLPDGRVQEFGKESIKERPLVQSAHGRGFLGWLGGPETLGREQFLAIPGIERGAVLEYYVQMADLSPGGVTVVPGQREDLPVRQFVSELRWRPDGPMAHRVFASRPDRVQLEDDRSRGLTRVVARDLPSVALEPLGGPRTDHILTVFVYYEPQTMLLTSRSGKVRPPAPVPASAPPWTGYATLVNWFSRDRGYATKRVRELADQLTRQAGTESEKAKAIHGWVSAQWQEYRLRPRPRGVGTAPRSLDDVLDWRKDATLVLADDDFLWLAQSLYLNSGLDAHTVLLPDREFTRFHRAAVSPLFLNAKAIAIRGRDRWMFSSPHHVAILPFDLLPWQQEGQEGLLALSHKQEFIPVPVSDPQRSVMHTTASLALDASGTLSGEFTRRMTGHLAVSLRAELRKLPASERAQQARKALGTAFGAAEVTVLGVSGVESAEDPLEVTARLEWPDFAVRTKDRLLIRPLVFRTEATEPLTAAERTNSIYFPYRWKETDEFTLSLPEGYLPEAAPAPEAVSSPSLGYQVTIAHDATTRTLSVRREYLSNLVVVPVDKYNVLRAFHGHVVRSDRHELILAKAVGSQR